MRTRGFEERFRSLFDGKTLTGFKQPSFGPNSLAVNASGGVAFCAQLAGVAIAHVMVCVDTGVAISGRIMGVEPTRLTQAPVTGWGVVEDGRCIPPRGGLGRSFVLAVPVVLGDVGRG